MATTVGTYRSSKRTTPIRSGSEKRKVKIRPWFLTPQRSTSSRLRPNVRPQCSSEMNLEKFFTELKRRNVYKVAVAYAVVAWLLIQVATQVFPFFEVPNWAVRLVVLLIIIGFPIALVKIGRAHV